jgi:hypothetical protein
MAEGYKDFTTGAVLTAADLEDYNQNQTVMRFASDSARNTALTTVKTEGMLALSKDTDTMNVYNGSTWIPLGSYAAWTSYTPVLAQGASSNISKTVSYSNYEKIGRRVTWQCRLAITGAGSSGSDITVTIPLTQAYTGGETIVGSGIYYDASATALYSLIVALQATGVLAFYIASGAQVSHIGTATVAFATANSDVLAFDATYETAS